MSNVDMVNVPSVEGKNPEEAVKILHKFMRETATQILALNRKIRELESKVDKGMRFQ